MTTSERTKAVNGLPGDLAQTIRRYLGNRWLLLSAAIIALVGGAALNWGWLVALGIAPALLSLLPCLIMCGLGLCGMKKMAGSGEKQPSQSNDATQARGSSSPIDTSNMHSFSPSTASCCHAGAGEAELSQVKDLQPTNKRSNPHA